MKKEITWKTKDGRDVRVIVALVTSKTINLDGDKSVVPCCEMDIVAYVAGDIVGTGRPVAETRQGCAARIGKLGISADNLSLINAVIAEVEITPEWQSKAAQIARAGKESWEYEQFRRRMDKVMAGY